VKKQFNENKYNLLTQKGVKQTTQLQKLPFQKQLMGTMGLMILGFNFTKRFYTFPHFHKDSSHPMLLANGELHPNEFQPQDAKSQKAIAGMQEYTKHTLAE
jgi:hypothetical protein